MQYRGYKIRQDPETYKVEIISLLGGNILYTENPGHKLDDMQLKAIIGKYVAITMRKVYEKYEL